MKKTISLMLCILMFAAFIGPSVLAEPIDDSKYHGKFNQIYVYDDMPTLKIEAYFDNYPELSNMMHHEYERLVNAIPEELRTRLKQCGVVVHLVNDVNSYYPSKRFPVNGFYNPSNNQIYLGSYYDPEYDSYDYVLTKFGNSIYHEFGHALDYAYGKKSYSKEFKKLYTEEIDNYFLGPDNPTELFADLFHLYMWDVVDCRAFSRISYSKLILTKKCIKSYEYIREALNLDDIYSLEWGFKNRLFEYNLEPYFTNKEPNLPIFITERSQLCILKEMESDMN